MSHLSQCCRAANVLSAPTRPRLTHLTDKQKCNSSLHRACFHCSTLQCWYAVLHSSAWHCSWLTYNCSAQELHSMKLLPNIFLCLYQCQWDISTLHIWNQQSMDIFHTPRFMAVIGHTVTYGHMELLMFITASTFQYLLFLLTLVHSYFKTLINT